MTFSISQSIQRIKFSFNSIQFNSPWLIRINLIPIKFNGLTVQFNYAYLMSNGFFNIQHCKELIHAWKNLFILLLGFHYCFQQVRATGFQRRANPFWTEILHKKNCLLEGQTRWANSPLPPVNFPSASSP